jgi:alkanesulfonate monooxygenase SsuD/methylene tetrahydromethanopterin reductase-like flavin-dependent oxidoreductase (luciferase family)
VWDRLEAIQRLWRGEPYAGTNGHGVAIEVPLLPRPVQRELPIWITSAGSIRTMTDAGAAGFGLLTHLLGQDYDDL